MKQVILVDCESGAGLQENVNSALRDIENDGEEFIDIKYSTRDSDAVFRYSAMIIYEAKKNLV